MLVSAISSVGRDAKNILRLPKVEHSVVILVDGLGYENFQQNSGHARFLRSLKTESFRCEFPSTTATSIAGFGTGKRSSEHGIIGYSVFDRESSAFINLLTGWKDAEEASRFKKVRSLSETHPINFIGSAAYKTSGFTELTMKSAKYYEAETIADRFSCLEAIFKNQTKSVNYLYIPELDQLAHRFGIESRRWLNALEELDMVVERFASKLGTGVGVVLTSDHGLIDVPMEGHVYLDEHDWYRIAVTRTAGDPRCNAVYLAGGISKQIFVEEARKVFGKQAFIASTKELTELGWTITVTGPSEKYQPDFYIIWNGSVVGYDRRTAKPQHLKMIGQHGGISDREMRIPLFRFGSY